MTLAEPRRGPSTWRDTTRRNPAGSSPAGFLCPTLTRRWQPVVSQTNRPHGPPPDPLRTGGDPLGPNVPTDDDHPAHRHADDSSGPGGTPETHVWLGSTTRDGRRVVFQLEGGDLFTRATLTIGQAQALARKLWDVAGRGGGKS